jgi:hypothetical protein
MAKLLTEINNILSTPELVREAAKEEEYYTENNHPEIVGEMVCSISRDVSKDAGPLGLGSQEIVNVFQRETKKSVLSYKTYLQYNTSTSDVPYVHTDQFLTLHGEDYPVNYICNVYLTPSAVAAENSWFEFFTADELDDSAEMKDYFKLADDKMTSIGTKSFEFNKGILFDSSIPHRNAPICNNYWGTNAADSPLCFTVFMNTT